MMLDLELRAKLSDHSIIEVFTIIRNDSFWNTVPTYEVMYDELGHNILGERSKSSYLDPFHEVINGNQDETVPIRNCQSNLSNHVDAPHCEWPRSSQDV